MLRIIVHVPSEARSPSHGVAAAVQPPDSQLILPYCLGALPLRKGWDWVACDVEGLD